MQNRLLTCVAFSVLGLVASAGWAQGRGQAPAPAPKDCRPAPTTLGKSQYPCIHPDLSVTFRVQAPLAQKVLIMPDPSGSENNGTSGLGAGPYEMTKDAEGNWTVTTPPARPGLHEYRMSIDGLTIADPNSEFFDILSGRFSAIEVPDPAFDAHLLKNVPHGQLRTVWSFSKLTNELRNSIVYTPPDYDANPTKRYPVLYLQNGGGQDETSWTREGHANFILDNLIAAGKAKPMIIVMNYSVATRSAGGPRADDEVPQQPTAFEKFLLTENIPFIDSQFRTIADSDHRALAGLSGGSGFAFIIGCGHPEVFSYVGVFSRAPYNANFDLQTIFNGAFTRPEKFNKEIHLLYWNTGTEEPRIYNFAHTATAAMNKVGIKAVLVDEPGFAHEWATWRRALYDFAPRLF